LTRIFKKSLNLSKDFKKRERLSSDKYVELGIIYVACSKVGWISYCGGGVQGGSDISGTLSMLHRHIKK
jgi:hypothetical protein